MGTTRDGFVAGGAGVTAGARPGEMANIPRLLAAGFLLCAGLLPVMARAQEAHPQPSLIAGLFSDFCLAEQPSLAAMEAKAGKLGGTKQSDTVVPIGTNRSLHQETWMIRRDNARFQLTAMAGDAAAGPYRAVGCGLTAADVNGADLVPLLQADLGPPDRHVPADGEHGDSVVWTKLFGLNEGRVLLNYGGALPNGAGLHLVLPKLPAAPPPPAAK